MKSSFFNEKIEFLIPIFLGVLGSFIFCSFAAASYSFFPDSFMEEYLYIDDELPAMTTEIISDSLFIPDINFSLASRERAPDPVLESYRDPEFTEWVIDFFTSICRDRQIAHAILHNANAYDVSPALAFALSWEESRFNPRAVNSRNRDGSIDRGLFQLNNRSFPYLELSDFFSINSNARYGISHLKFCLDTGGTEVSGLAMYNAGTGRVMSSGAPKVTLDYASRILNNRLRIEEYFILSLRAEQRRRLAEAVQLETEEEEEIEEPEAPPSRMPFTVSPL